MLDDDSEVLIDSLSEGRRRLLRKLAVGLPAVWVAPLVASVTLPLHAYSSGQVAIADFRLSESEFTIGGSSNSWQCDVSNTGEDCPGIVLQTWIDQNATYRAAGGASANCGLGSGIVPAGGCTHNGSSNANDTTSAGSGSLAAGAAFLRVELKLNGDVIDVVNEPITLVEP